MSIFNFPPNPEVGDIWVVGTKTYSWNGVAWIVVATSVSSSIVAPTITVTSSTQTTSTNTGALTVVGGVGIGGDLWVGGTLYIAEQAVLTTSSFAYSIDEGPDIDITLSPTSGALVFSNTSNLQTVTSRGNNTDQTITISNVSNSTSTSTGALLVHGGIGVAKNVVVGGSLNIGPTIAGQSVPVFYSNSVVLVSYSTPLITTYNTVVLDTYSALAYRTARYTIQIYGDGKLHCSELMVSHNDTTVVIGEYGIITTAGELGTFDATLVDGTVTVAFVPTSVNEVTIKLVRFGIAA